MSAMVGNLFKQEPTTTKMIMSDPEVVEIFHGAGWLLFFQWLESIILPLVDDFSLHFELRTSIMQIACLIFTIS